MQNLLGRTSRRVKLSLYIACAIFLIVSCIPDCSSSQSLSSEEKSVVIDDNESNSYQIIHVSEVPSSNDDDEHVITYQQNEEEDIIKSTNDPRTIAVKSKGFDKSTSAQFLIVSQFKDSCRKNASLPSWKIDKGTTNGDFQLKINYEPRLSEADFYLCVKSEKREQHLGLSSAFRLSR